MPANIDEWDERYRRGEHSTNQPSPLLRQAIQNLKPGLALDIASGVGRHAIFLAENRWRVTAVDSSGVGIDILKQRAREAGVAVNARVTNLEKSDFQIEPHAYDLICDFYYLQRNLFPAIRVGVKAGGSVVAAIHLNDGKADAKPHNPAFLLDPGELRDLFSDWEITYYREGRSDEGGHHHDTAYLIARKPGDTRADSEDLQARGN
jgi:SAM-dependent methyltransferase